MGKSTRGLQLYFNCIEEDGHHLLIPRGFAGRLIRFCRSNHIASVLVDQRQKLPQVNIHCSAEMRSHQMEALKAASVKNYGIISAPPGTGKTVMALKIIADKKQPALIIVHRKHLLEQWMERIEAFFGIPKKKIGRIAQGKVKIGKMVTVALIQSLGKKLETSDSEKIVSSFGTVVVDECHYMPSKTFSSSISKLAPYYQYGFTATPFRKGSDGKLISIYLGETITEIRPQDVHNYQRPRIIIRITNFEVTFDSKTDSFETLSKILIHDSARNQLIIKDVVSQLNSGRRVIVITERKDHIDTLNQFLKFRFETITLSGGDPEPARNSKMKLLNKGLFQVLITTG